MKFRDNAHYLHGDLAGTIKINATWRKLLDQESVYKRSYCMASTQTEGIKLTQNLLPIKIFFCSSKYLFSSF
jgi:hypothetical protein